MSTHHMAGIGEFEFEDGARFEVTYNLALRTRMLRSPTGTLDQGTTGGQGTIRPRRVDASVMRAVVESTGKRGILFLEDGRRMPLLVFEPGPTLKVRPDGEIIEAEDEGEA